MFDRQSLKDFTYISACYITLCMQAFAALGDPTRRRIVELLADREYPAGELARKFDMTPPAVSQHLRTLRAAGLVRVRRDAQRRIYALDPQGLAEIDAWIGRYRRFWSDALGRLDRELAKPAP